MMRKIQEFFRHHSPRRIAGYVVLYTAAVAMVSSAVAADWYFDGNGGLVNGVKLYNGSGQAGDYGSIFDTSKLSLSHSNKTLRCVGWYADASGSFQYCKAGESLYPIGQSHAYAKWVQDRYPIFFVSNDGRNLTNQQYAVASQYVDKLNLNTFERSGYCMIGWSTDSSATAASWADGQENLNLDSFRDYNDFEHLSEDGVPLYPVTLYAVWVKQFSLTFDANGAAGEMKGIVLNEGVPCYLPKCSFTPPLGHKFSVWTSSFGNYNDQSEVVYNSAKWDGTVGTFIAQWIPVSYKVKFDSNGGTGTMDPLSMRYGDRYTLTPCKFSRKGYTFVGWAKSAGGEKVYNDNDEVANLTDADGEVLTLFAVWAPIHYFLKFDSAGGSGSMDDLECEYDRVFNLPANGFTRAGATFEGWGAKALDFVDFADSACVSNLSAVAGSTNVLHAVWSNIGYHVEFNGNGGSGELARMDCEYGTEYLLPSNGYSRTGYVFTGWATNATDAAAFPEGLPTSNLTVVADASVELFAAWRPIRYVVTFDANGGEGTMAPQTNEYDVANALPSVGYTNRGLNFSGWATEAYGQVRYGDGAVICNLTTVENAECRLYAIWATEQSELNPALDNTNVIALKDEDDCTYVSVTNYDTAVNGTCVKIDGDAANAGTKGFSVHVETTGELTFSWKVVNVPVMYGEIPYKDNWDLNVVDTGTGSRVFNIASGFEGTEWADVKIVITNAPATVQFLFKRLGFDSKELYSLFDHVRWVSSSQPEPPKLYTVLYDVNGGDPSATPLPSVLEVGVAEATTTLPVLANSVHTGSWMFLGWSAGRGSTSAEYAGGSVYSDPSATEGQTNALYAVWAAAEEGVDCYEPSADGFDARGVRWQYRHKGDVVQIVSVALEVGASEAVEVPASMGGCLIGGIKAIPAAQSLRFLGDRPVAVVDDAGTMQLKYIEFPATNETWNAGALGGCEGVAHHGFVGPIATMGGEKCYFWTNADETVVFAYAEDELPAEVTVPETVDWGGVVWTVSGFEKTCFSGQPTTSLRYPASWTEKMWNVDPEDLPDGIESVAPAGEYHTVKFEGGAGAVGTMPDCLVPDGYGFTVPANGFTRNGYTFLTWRNDGGVDVDVGSVLTVTDDVTLFAGWDAVRYTITYVLDGGVNAAENPAFYTIESSITLANPVRDGYVFDGWTPNSGVIPIGSVGEKTFTANWTAVAPPPPPPAELVLFDSVEGGGINPKGSTYNGFLGENGLGGTFTLTVKKPKNGISAATMTLLDPVTGKKVKRSGSVDSVTGVCTGGLEGLVLGAKGLTGVNGGWTAQGAVDASKAKDAEALAVMSGFNKRIYSLVIGGAAGGACLLKATFSTKGKVKVTGTIGAMKVSGSAQMSIGDRCAVPFLFSKKGVRVSFVLWFDKTTRNLLGVTGLNDGETVVAFGESATPPPGEYTMLINAADVAVAVPNAIAETPNEIGLSWNGKKFDAGKAATVKYDRKAGSVIVNTAKGDNISGLKLKYSKGSLSGSYTVYGFDGNKLTKNKFTISGVVIDGVGYVSGTNKKLGSVWSELVK